MIDQFSRSRLVIGENAVNKISEANIAIFGVGGVGGYVVEALARSGIKNFTLVDNDIISITNINRQIIATLDTLNRDKVEVMKERILSINKEAKVVTKKCFFLPSNQDEFDFTKYDYIVDAVDTVSAKIALVIKSYEANVPIISAMGAGNKINVEMLRISDIYKTKVDPLCKVMRYELKKRNIKKLKVAYSLEKPLKSNEIVIEETNKRSIPGSMAFVPSAMGLLIASEIIKDLTGIRNDSIGG